MILKAIQFNSRDELLNFVKKLHQNQVLTVKYGLIQTPIEVLARAFIVATNGLTYLVADLLSLSIEDFPKNNLSFFSQSGEVHSLATVISKLRQSNPQHDYINNKPLADALIAIKYSRQLLYSNHATLDVITRAPSFSPVITRDEINYDKDSLMEWFAHLQKSQQAIFSPSTRRAVLSNEVFDNHALLSLTRLMLGETKINLLRFLDEYYQDPAKATHLLRIIEIFLSDLRAHELGLVAFKNRLECSVREVTFMPLWLRLVPSEVEYALRFINYCLRYAWFNNAAGCFVNILIGMSKPITHHFEWNNQLRARELGESITHLSERIRLANQAILVTANLDNRMNDIHFFDDLNWNDLIIRYDFEKNGEGIRNVLASDIATSQELANAALRKVQFAKIKLMNESSSQQSQEIQALVTWLKQYEKECHQLESGIKAELKKLPSSNKRLFVSCLPSKSDVYLTRFNDYVKKGDFVWLACLFGIWFIALMIMRLQVQEHEQNASEEFSLSKAIEGMDVNDTIKSLATFNMFVGLLMKLARGDIEIPTLFLNLLSQMYLLLKRCTDTVSQSLSRVVEPTIMNAVATIQACKNAADQQKLLSAKLARHEPITQFFANLNQNETMQRHFAAVNESDELMARFSR